MAAGVVGAPFSLGLTIPLGGVVGGGAGLVAGGAGCVAAGATGYAVYAYRVQIKDGVMHVRAKVSDGAESATVKLTCTVASIKGKGAAASTSVMNVMCTLKTKSIEGSGRVKASVLDLADGIKVKSRALGVQLKENRVTAGSTV